jgi:hypothetical protein
MLHDKLRQFFAERTMLLHYNANDRGNRSAADAIGGSEELRFSLRKERSRSALEDLTQNVNRSERTYVLYKLLWQTVGLQRIVWCRPCQLVAPLPIKVAPLLGRISIEAELVNVVRVSEGKQSLMQIKLRHVWHELLTVCEQGVTNRPFRREMRDEKQDVRSVIFIEPFTKLASVLLKHFVLRRFHDECRYEQTE